MSIWKALAVMATLAALGLAFIFWAASPHSPALSSQMAATLIRAEPEFNQRGTLVSVVQTERGHDSLNTCCYTVNVKIRQRGATDAMPARADFRFYDKRWHLSSVRWGDPPNVTFLHIEP